MGRVDRVTALPSLKYLQGLAIHVCIHVSSYPTGNTFYPCIFDLDVEINAVRLL